MKGVNFFVEKPVPETLPNRVDVACFVGLVACRKTEAILEDEPGIKTWLEHRGYFHLKPSKSGEMEEYLFGGVEQLLDVPVPVEDWPSFDRLFAWDQRPIEGSQENVRPTWV
jgi:hypothetical protein